MADARQRKIFWRVFIALFLVTFALPVLPVYKGNISLGPFPLVWAYMDIGDDPTLLTALDALLVFETQVALSVCAAAYVSSLAGPKQLGR